MNNPRENFRWIKNYYDTENDKQFKKGYVIRKTGILYNPSVYNRIICFSRSGRYSDESFYIILGWKHFVARQLAH